MNRPYIPPMQQAHGKKIYLVFYSSKYCIPSKQFIEYLEQNKNSIKETQCVRVCDIIDLINNKDEIPDYLESVPAIIITDSETNSIQSEDDIIFGTSNVIKNLEQILKENRKISAFSNEPTVSSGNSGNFGNMKPKITNSDWITEAQKIQSKKDVPIGTNIFAIKCGKKDTNDKNIDIAKILSERNDFNKELGIQEDLKKSDNKGGALINRGNTGGTTVGQSINNGIKKMGERRIMSSTIDNNVGAKIKRR
jgi:hypothetical protein